jgi:hypothetical protein
MREKLPYLQGLGVFQAIRLELVKPDQRMIGVTDEVIQAGLADADPTSAIALALTEVLCLRETIGRMIAKEMKAVPSRSPASLRQA